MANITAGLHRCGIFPFRLHAHILSRQHNRFCALHEGRNDNANHAGAAAVTHLPLDPGLPLAGRIREAENAVLVPPAGPERPQPCGAFAMAQPLTESLCFGGSATVPVNVFPSLAEPQQHLTGTWLFGGILSGHFGHMLCEGPGRLWALAGRTDIEGILFFARPFDKANRCRRMFAHLAALLDLPPVQMVTVPTQVERLILAEQGLGSGELLNGRTEARAFLRDGLARTAPEGKGRRFYISRSGQPARRGRILGEDSMEQQFATAGYEVIRPEEFPLAQQVAMFRAATHVCGTEGSPFHLLAMAGQTGCKVAVIQRRRSPTFAQICQHLDIFLGTETLQLDAVHSIHAPRKTGNANLVYLEPARETISAQLAEAGFLPPGTQWPEMSDDERNADLLRLQEAINQPLLRNDSGTSPA